MSSRAGSVTGVAVYYDIRVELFRLGAFLGFLVLGHCARTRPRINLFIIYVLGLSVAIGFTQRDAWPFSTYRLANQTWKGTSVRPYTKVSFYGVDARGNESEVDASAWSPLFPVVMQFYFRDVYPTLSRAGKDNALRFLLSLAESSRVALAAGRRYGNERLLGPLTAPDWAIYARHRDAPAAPWTGLRVYRDTWIPIERLDDPNRFQRVTVGTVTR